MSVDVVRSLVLWIPDWPIVALARETGTLAGGTGTLAGGTGTLAREPVAIMRANKVIACSAAARAEGVRRGQRRRDAQARCPALQVVADDAARDHRGFLPIVEAIEARAPGVQIIRPGLCALRARGPARYYGGEEDAARVLRESLDDLGIPDTRAGVADGPFTAEQAARRTGPGGILVVPSGDTAAFLSGQSITTLEDEELIGLLARLGVRTLGEFAELDVEKVRGRFGERGIRLHALAGGRDPRAVIARTPPPELQRQIAFEPPLELVDQIGFGVRTTADEFIDNLTRVSLVCTELRVELTDERGGFSERVWLHPTCFDAPDVVDRVRWQLESAIGNDLKSGVALVRLIPQAVDAASHHEPGLFGQGAEERVHHALSRVQAMLGHRGVTTPTLGGGRWLSERQTLVPWGDRATVPRSRAQPWPGHLPAPLPSTVFPAGQGAAVTDREGRSVSIDGRGLLSAPPAQLGLDGRQRPVAAWAGPWPVRERIWDAERARTAYRLQVVDADQTAWMLVNEGERWWAEGRYD
ncbi:MAG: DNA polymerase Y family protein [Microbacterium sp.]|uniref:DNA polymerase Y family protein n=1 Tax=Microbacterium sp. TaxID=51671 RepID=UPI002723166F|nr:DNA polymerase Y family protein [Microbacterium sp.]MDO8384302.1 DNA polymerase Y family protein [Microbacterium sp.]